MIEGVTVLSQYTQYTQDPSSLVLGILICIIGFVVAVGGLIYSITHKTGWADFILNIVAIMLSLIIGTAISSNISYEKENIYKVTVNKYVTFQEFQERYEILAQDGDIYEVRER